MWRDRSIGHVLAEHEVEHHAQRPDVAAHAHHAVTLRAGTAAIYSLAHHFGGEPLQCSEVIVPLLGVLFRADRNALEGLARAKIGNEARDRGGLLGATPRSAGHGGVQQDVLRLEVVVHQLARVHAVEAQQHVQEDCGKVSRSIDRSAALLTAPHQRRVEWHRGQQIAPLASHAHLVGAELELRAQHVVVEVAAVGVLHQDEQARHLRAKVRDLIELEPRVLVVDEVRVLGQRCGGSVSGVV